MRQTSVPEAAVLGGKLETRLAFPARAGGGPLWICSLPCPGWQEARAGQAPQRLRLRWRAGGCRGLGSEYVSSRLHRTVRGRGVCAACFPEEVHARSRECKSTRLNSSHLGISYAVFCLKKKHNPT